MQHLWYARSTFRIIFTHTNCSIVKSRVLDKKIFQSYCPKSKISYCLTISFIYTRNISMSTKIITIKTERGKGQSSVEFVEPTPWSPTKTFLITWISSNRILPLFKHKWPPLFTSFRSSHQTLPLPVCDPTISIRLFRIQSASTLPHTR